MKILHLIQRYPPAIGGSETWCRMICRYLAQQGHEVNVLTLNVYNEDEYWRDPPVENCLIRFGRLEYDGRIKVRRCKRVKIHPLTFNIFKLLDRFFQIYFYGPHSMEMYMRILAEAAKADIIHLNTIPYPHNFIGLFVAKLFRKKVVITPHFHIGHPHYENKANFWLMDKCGAIFAVTEREKEYFISKGLDRNKICVAYNSIDIAEYEPKDSADFKGKIFEKYNVKYGTNIIIYVGRKMEYKGIDTLIEAVKILRKEMPLKLFLIGPNVAWFDEYYSKLSLEEKEDIIDFGIVSHQDKVNLMHLSHLLVLPSKFEAFGIVFLEAWICGLPVIGSDIETISEVIAGSGLTFHLKDVNSLKENIKSLLLDDELRKKLGNEGRKRTIDNFDYSVIGKQVIGTYYSLLFNTKSHPKTGFKLYNRVKGFFSRSLTINWFVTWKCNYQCEYCWQEIGKKFYKNFNSEWKSAELWAEAFNRLKPETIEITGGEPTLYPELIKVMTLLNPGICLTMTTNLSNAFNISEFAEKLRPLSQGGTIGKIALSFHPAQADFEEFLSKAEFLKKKGFDLQINYVLYPAQMWKVEYFQKEFRKFGLEMHIEPFVAPSMVEGGKPVFFNKDEIEWIKKWISQGASLENKDRRGKQQFIPGTLRDDDENFKKEWGVDKRPVLCQAGRRVLTLDENGDAYTCVSALTRSKIFGFNALPHYKKIGNIFSKKFSLLKKPVLCWEVFRCCGCDFDRISGYWEYPFVPKEKWIKVPE